MSITSATGGEEKRQHRVDKDSEGKRLNRIMGIKSTETELITDESVLKVLFLDVPVITQ